MQMQRQAGFGKRNTRSQSQQSVGPGKPHLSPAEQTTDAIYYTLFYTGIVASAFVFYAVIQFVTPITYPSQTIYYTNQQMASSNLSSFKLPKYRKQDEQKYGIDFSSILTPEEEEKTDFMRSVAVKCLPAGAPSSLVMPDKVYSAFVHSTKYLICAMNTNKKRFCNRAERMRLVEQLIQYKNRRQNALGVQRNRERLLASRQARQMVRMSRMIDNANKPRATNFPRVGKQIDARIAQAIKNLREEGYLAASDFGWFGLILPAEYAPMLSGSSSAPQC